MMIVVVVVAGIVVGVAIELVLSRRARRREPAVEPIEGTLLPPPPPSPPRDRARGRSARSELVVGEDGTLSFIEPEGSALDGDDGTTDEGPSAAH
jgi:hypothetical protein